MKQSIYQTKNKQLKKRKAQRLYREGLTLREVGKAVGRSHQWVANALKDLTRIDAGRIIKSEGKTPRKAEEIINQNKQHYGNNNSQCN